MSLLNEFKRRNVFRVAIGYGVVAWVLAQIADRAFENFGAPAWVAKPVLFILVLGFPLAVFFAWVFELTPEGIKREKDVDRDTSITAQTGKKLNGLTSDRAFVFLIRRSFTIRFIELDADGDGNDDIYFCYRSGTDQLYVRR